MAKSKLTIIFSALLALGIIISVTLVLTLHKEKKPVITPLSRQQADNSASPGSMKTPTYYINTAQQLLVRAEEVSQNNHQSEEDKKRILALIKTALETVNEGIHFYPQDDRLFAQRAKIYQGITSFSPQALDAALADLEQARQLSPQNPNYPKMQSILFTRKGNFSAAAYYAKLAYELAPTDTENLRFLGNIQVKAGQIEEAVQSYQKLAALTPENKPQHQEIIEKISSLNSLLAQAKEKSPAIRPLLPPTITAPAQERISTEFLPKGQALAQQDLIIAQPNQENTLKQTGEVDLNAVSGEGVIKAGQTTATIANRHLSEQSQVYLSPLGDIDNRILFLKSKNVNEQEKFFVVAINKPADKDIKFNWWIID